MENIYSKLFYLIMERITKKKTEEEENKGKKVKEKYIGGQGP